MKASRAARTASSRSLLAPFRRAPPLGPADLHHRLAVLLQGAGEPRAELQRLPSPTATAGSLRSGEVSSRRYPAASVATEVGHQAAGRVDDGGGQGVAVGVDADDDGSRLGAKASTAQ